MPTNNLKNAQQKVFLISNYLRETMKTIFLMIIFAGIATGITGCALFNGETTEEINISEGIDILVNQDGEIVIDEEQIKVDQVMEKLSAMKVQPTDVIVIKVSPRASQWPVLQILDQLGDAKFTNVNIARAKE